MSAQTIKTKALAHIEKVVNKTTLPTQAEIDRANGLLSLAERAGWMENSNPPFTDSEPEAPAPKPSKKSKKKGKK